MTDKPTLAETVERLKALYASLADTDAPAAPALARAIEVCERVQAQGAHPVSAPAGIDVAGWLRGVSDALAWARGER